MTEYFSDQVAHIASWLRWANEDGWRTRRAKEWSAMGIRRIMTFMLPWKENGEDDESCGKFFLKEMRENPNLDGDKS